jgi:hypothetical protein
LPIVLLKIDCFLSEQQLQRWHVLTSGGEDEFTLVSSLVLIFRLDDVLVRMDQDDTLVGSFQQTPFETLFP